MHSTLVSCQEAAEKPRSRRAATAACTARSAPFAGAQLAQARRVQKLQGGTHSMGNPVKTRAGSARLLQQQAAGGAAGASVLGAQLCPSCSPRLPSPAAAAACPPHLRTNLRLPARRMR